MRSTQISILSEALMFHGLDEHQVAAMILTFFLVILSSFTID